MADINVIFPKGSKAIVRNDGEVLSSGALVTWCFHTDDSRIEFVEVEFADPKEHQFFLEAREHPHRFVKRVANGRADFYGHVPAYTGRTSTVIAKYTVRGLGGDQKTAVDGEMTVLDPVLITPRP